MALMLLILQMVCTSQAKPVPSTQHSAGQIETLRGQAELRRGKERPRPARRLSKLRDGDVLAIWHGEATVALYRSEWRYAISAGAVCRVGLEDLKPLAGPAPRRIQMATQTTLSPATTKLGPFLGVSARGGDEGAPHHPAPGFGVRDRPRQLEWVYLPRNSTGSAARSLQLRITQLKTGRTVLSRPLPFDATHYTLPPNLLRTGIVYLWSVREVTANREGEGFRVPLRILTVDEAAELVQTQEMEAAMRAAAPDDPAPYRMLALTYERLGMFKAALDTWESLLHRGPARDAAAEADQLRKWLGMPR